MTTMRDRTRSLMAWLAEPVLANPFEIKPWCLPEEPTRLQIYAALLRMDTGGYGVIDSGGIYGRSGLEQNEAYCWWDMRAYVAGWLAGTMEAERDAFREAVEAEWARVQALVATEDPEP